MRVDFVLLGLFFELEKLLFDPSFLYFLDFLLLAWSQILVNSAQMPLLPLRRQ